MIKYHIDKHRCERSDLLNHSEIAKVFKAFCDERRIDILVLLLNGEKCACSLLEELDISQSTLSHHMKILCESKVVTSRKEGKWTYYSIDQGGSQIAKTWIEQLTSASTKECERCSPQ